MRVYCLILTLVSLTYIECYPQNLVPNPSFEDTLDCPEFPGEVWKAAPWFDPTGASSDYYNQCNTTTDLSVPINSGGKQNARTGVAYVASVFYINSNGREYVEVELTQSLVADKEYCVEYYVSLAERSYYAIGELGAYLSVDTLTSTDFFAIPVIPQVENSSDNIISDTANWIKISGAFIATGGERFLTIGNFNNNSNTTKAIVGSDLNNNFAYYYIDDVAVFLCSDTLELKIPNVFTPNNDEWNNQFAVENLPEGASVQIYNRWGVLITEWNTPNGFWDGRMKGGVEASTGVYYCIVKLPDGEMKSSFVHLMR